MMYESMPLTYLNIYCGSRFTESILVEDSAGTPIPLASDGDWAARAQLRSYYAGPLVVTFASSGSSDGTITFTDDGEVTLALSSTFTATLQPTVPVVQTLPLVGDVELWNTGTPTDKVRVTDLRVRIYPEATTS